MKTYGGKHGTANIEARQPIDREINKIYLYRKPNSNTWIFSLFFVFLYPTTFVYLQTIPTSTPLHPRKKEAKQKGKK